MPTASLLQVAGRTIVVDCGLGVTRGIVDAGVPLRDIDMVLVTHLHSDHVLELGALLHTAWTAGLSKTVRVFGPTGTAALWRDFRASMAFDIATRIADEGRPDLRDLVELHEFAEGPVIEDGDLRISALRVEHPPVSECYALAVEADGRRIVFSSDTAWFAPLARFAKGADILVHEAMHGEGVDRLVARTGNGARLKEHLMASHTLAADVGRIATEAECRHLVLNHLVPADDPAIGEAEWIDAVRATWDGPLTVGRDGLVLSLDNHTAAEGQREKA